MGFVSAVAADADGNPCTGHLDYALAFGTSHTGRVLRQLIYEGFCEDEQGRQAVDGVLTNIGGPLRTEAELRFGQPSFIGADSPSFAFPFTDATQMDPLTGETDGLLARLDSRALPPKIMLINTPSEHVNLDVGLIHLSTDGQGDAVVPDNVCI